VSGKTLLLMNILCQDLLDIYHVKDIYLFSSTALKKKSLWSILLRKMADYDVSLLDKNVFMKMDYLPKLLAELDEKGL
jgi:hypothetical protein